MPIYEYACGKCEHEFEAQQRMSDDPIKTCPKCRARKVKRLISQTSFVLKGGGWYSDLYSSSKPDSKKDGESKDSGEKSSKKDDAKPSSDGESKSKPKDKPKGKKAAA